MPSKSYKTNAAKSIIKGSFVDVECFLNKQEQREYYLSPDLYASCYEKTEKEIEILRASHSSVVERYKQVVLNRAKKFLNSVSLD